MHITNQVDRQRPDPNRHPHKDMRPARGLVGGRKRRGESRPRKAVGRVALTASEQRAAETRLTGQSKRGLTLSEVGCIEGGALR